MAYIYMDESGDLGFNKDKKNSKYFVVTFLFTNNKRPIEKIIRKTHSQLNKSLKKKINSLHATKEKPTTRRRLLTKLSEKDCNIMIIYLNKDKVYSKLQNEKTVLYNYVTNILLDRVFSKTLIDINSDIKLIASRRETNKFLNENFKKYLEQQVFNNHNKKITINIVAPHSEKLLQAVDFASWAVYRKYEYNDDLYYNYIKNIIIEEKGLF